MRHVFTKRIRVTRTISVSMTTVLLSGLLCLVVFAYLIASGRAVNDLKPAPEVTPTVTDQYAVSVSDYKYTVYIRAAVTVNWVKGNSIYAHAPEAGTDYNITFDTAKWFFHDGFYYYRVPVESGKATSELLRGFTQSDGANVPEGGYTLTLTMVAQAIQAKGTTDVSGDITASGKPAVSDAWGVEVDGSGNLIDPTP